MTDACRFVSLRLPVVLAALIGVLSACSSAPTVAPMRLAPAPEDVETRLALTNVASSRYLYGENYEPLPASSLVDYHPAPPSDGGRRLAVRTLDRVAQAARKLENNSVEELLEQYQGRFDDLQRRYVSFENFMGDLGMGRTEVRQGVGITTATAAATIGTLHAFHPVAVSPQLLGTGIRAGYDISRLDDPRMMIAYADRLRVSVSKDGLGGTLSGEHLSYTADLNIRKLEASANMTLDNNLTLGTVYAHNDQVVQGFVKLSF